MMNFTSVQVYDIKSTMDLSPKLLSDCVLVGNGIELKCHAVLLAASSPLFFKLLSDVICSKRECDDIVVHLPDYDTCELKLLLDIMTEGQGFYHGSSDYAGNFDLQYFFDINVCSFSVEKCDSLDVNKKRASSINDCIEEISDVESVDEIRDIFTLKRDSSPAPDFVVTPCYDDDSDLSGDLNNDMIEIEHLPGLFESSEVSFYSEDSHCSRSCGGNCHAIYSVLKDEEKSKFQELFSGRKLIDMKQKLLDHLYSQDVCGLPVHGYYLSKHLFCLGYLTYQTNISYYMLKAVLSDFWEGRKNYVHGNKGISKDKTTSISFISWMVQFCEINGQYAPDEEVIILPHWLSKRVLYDMYLNETIGPHLALSSFYALFKKKFGAYRDDPSFSHIRISKYSSHSVCNICAALKSNKRQAKTEFELNVAQEKINQHRLVYTGARKKIEDIIQSALSHPDDNLGK